MILNIILTLSIISQIAKQCSEIKQIDFDFTEIRQSEMLREPSTAEGHIWYSSPDNIRMEYYEPVRYTVDMTNPSSKRIARIVSQMINGKLLLDSKQFKSESFQKGNIGTVILKPVTGNMFRSITMRYDLEKKRMLEIKIDMGKETRQIIIK